MKQLLVAIMILMIILSVTLTGCGDPSSADSTIDAASLSSDESVAAEPMLDYAGNDDGTWTCNGIIYRNKYTFTGWLPNAAKALTYVVLSNSDDVTFHDVWWSILSSDSADFLDPNETVIVDMY